MIEILIVIGVIYLLYQLIKFLIVKVIIPLVVGAAKITAVLGVITAVAAVGIALIVSLVNYFRSIRQNRDAYAGYVDSSPQKSDVEARRGYFFGPGYHQISAIIKGTWSNHGKAFAVVKKWAMIPVLGWIFFIFYCVAQGVFGSIFTIMFSAFHFVVVFAFMCVFYFLFSLLWVFDRIVLLSNAIASRCPQCKHISVIPAFICPSCGRHHRNLVPGPYGVFARRCSCGRSLPTTFLTGRSKLEARCPRCESDLASGSATQFGIQLIGGSSAGKTVFLASFLHLYLEKVKALKGISVKTHPQEDFDNLERLFREGGSESTNEMNAKMYSIVHTKGRLGISHEFAFYDVAGEVFAGQSTDSEQRQYGYCEGIVLVVDPFSLRNVRQAYADQHQGKEPVNFSKTDTNDVVVGFINEYTRIGSIKAGQKSNIPVSVVIAKADVDVVKSEIGPQRIADTYRKNPQLYPTEKDARDTMCRDYLRAGGMDNMINNLTAQFKQIHYFPASAMGHEQGNSKTYDPWGVLDAVLWIILERYQALAAIMGEKKAIIKKIGRRLAAAAMTTAMIAAVVLAGYFFVSNAPVWFGQLTSKILLRNKQPVAEITETVEAPKVTATVTNPTLNVRAAPMGKILGTVKEGDVLTVTGSVQNGWVPVELDGQAAFVSADLVKITEHIKAGLYDGETFIQELQDLNEARKWLVKNARDGGDYTIVLDKDQEITEIVFDYGGKTVTVTLKASAGEKTITFGTPSFSFLSLLSSFISSIDTTYSLFTVKSGATLVLEDGVTLSGSGAQEKTTSLVKVNGGTFVMNGGAITGNRTNTNGGGVYVESGTFTMNNGVISENDASGAGGGVYVNNNAGAFTMNGGTISGNTTRENGGGVSVHGGTFIKTGGIIYGSDVSVEQANKAPSDDLGHAVFVKDVGVRNATAWKNTVLDSKKNGL